MEAHLVLLLAARHAAKGAFDDEGGEVLGPSRSITLAKTMKMSAKPPFVIHIFSPFSTKLPSGCRAAAVFAPSASDPEPDSLRQYAPTISPVISFGRYLRFCASVPKSDSGRIVRLACAPKVAPKDADPRHVLADDHRRDFVELHAAVLFGDIDREEPQLAAPDQQPSRDGPVLLLQAVELRQDLACDELFGRPRDETLFLRDAFGRPHGLGIRGGQQPLAAAENGDGLVGGGLP